MADRVRPFLVFLWLLLCCTSCGGEPETAASEGGAGPGVGGGTGGGIGTGGIGTGGNLGTGGTGTGGALGSGGAFGSGGIGTGGTGTGGALGTGGTGTGGNLGTGGTGTGGYVGSGGTGTGGDLGTGGTGAGGDLGTGGAGTGGDLGSGGLGMAGEAGSAGSGTGGDPASGGTGTGGDPGSGGSGTGGSTVDCDYYVATDGSDSNPGTVDQPFETVGQAQSRASAGDLVCIRGGTYAFSGTGTVGVSFTKSGQAGNPIMYWAYPGETPVFDLSNLTPGGRVTGLDVHCGYIHLRGLEVTGVHQYQGGQDSWGVRIQGSGNIIENLNVHHNDAPGIFITSGADNLILNCDSHHNYDYLEDGGSGDGIGCHSSGSNNVIRGCRAYDNSDDGYDFINASGSCMVESSFAFRNGYVPDTTTGAGNGAGFKAGGYGSPPNVPSGGAATHTVRNCVAFGNRAQGFYANHHPGRIDFYNNTAFRNSVNYNMLADDGYPSSHEIHNNVAMSPGTAISNLTGGTDTFNSWNLSVTVSSDDFLSVDEALAEAVRQADGSLPNVDFMRLAAGSDLIDAGTDVGLPYNGSAPDLGAFEY